MKKIIVMLIGLIFTLAVNAGEKKTEFGFESVGNDSAEIGWKFYEDKTFVFSFRTLEKKNADEMKGKWEVNGSEYHVTFMDLGKFKKELLDGLFHVPGGDYKKIESKDPYKLSFSKTSSSLKIWSIQCERKI